MEQQITCINCPVGCRLQVVVENGEVKSVTGNSCNRGITYAKQECVAPQRMVTAVVPVAGRKCPVSVKTRTPIPKEPPPRFSTPAPAAAPWPTPVPSRWTAV